jgi:hypothetical protein
MQLPFAMDYPQLVPEESLWAVVDFPVHRFLLPELEWCCRRGARDGAVERPIAGMAARKSWSQPKPRSSTRRYKGIVSHLCCSLLSSSTTHFVGQLWSLREETKSPENCRQEKVIEAGTREGEFQNTGMKP